MALRNTVAVLVWKNWLLHKHHYIVTIFEITLPLLLSFQLAYIVRNPSSGDSTEKNPQDVYRNPTIYEPFTPTDHLVSKSFDIFYAPNTTFTYQLMNAAFGKYRNISLHPVFSEEHIEKLAKARNGLLENYVDGAVIFSEHENSINTSVFKYKLRLPMNNFFDKAEKAYYISNMPGPRNGISKYQSSGFLGMQISIDLAYIEYCQKVKGVKTENIEFNIQRMPYPPYKELKNELTIIDFIPKMVIYGLLVFCPVISKRIVDEKNNGAKEMMKMMGMSTGIYWGSQFITNFILMFIISGMTTIIYAVEGEGGARVLGNSCAGLFFVVMLMYSTGSILFCFLITTFINKASLAVSATVILWTLSYEIPHSHLIPLGENNHFASTSYLEKAFSCLIPNMAFTWATKIMSAYETFGIGAHWDNIDTPPFKGTDDFCLGTVLTVMLISYILYGFLIWYVDAVWPWQPGLPKSPLFFLTNSRKTVEINSGTSRTEFTVEKQSKSEYFEEEPLNIEPSVVISHITKTFVMGGITKHAVNDLSLNMYSGQITVLLGHNGAGKTTLMSIITGMFPPTKGSVTINGYNVVTETEMARKKLGLCPQHNVLYDSLTVEEHLKIFAGLKGMDWVEMDAEVTKILNQLHLMDKRYTMSKDLSGGMKRKLSLGIAIIGSQILILDEPTSGMDPEARRVMWDALQKLRHGCTMLLTMHYMEEADALGDRIAIMAKGSLQCCGSSIFLKGKFGAGYHLHINKGYDCKVNEITRIVKHHVPGAALVSNVNLELSYSLSSSINGFFFLFEELERSYQQLGIASCGVTITTMEDVFLKVGYMAEVNSSENCNDETNPLIQEPANIVSSFKYSTKSSGSKLLTQQMKALFVKRANYAKRHPLMLLFQFIIPFLITSFLVDRNADAQAIIDNTPDSLKLDLDEKFEDSIGFCHLNVTTQKTLSLIQYFNETLESESVNVISIENPEEFLLNKGSEDLKSYKENYLVGGSFSKTEGKLCLTSWYNGDPYHLDPISANLMTTSLLQYYLENSKMKIETVAHPLPVSVDLEFTSDLLDFISRLLYAVFIPLALTFLMSSFVLFPVHERVSKAKLLQRMCGVSGFVHWLVNFQWDFVIHFFCSLLLLIPFLVHDTASQFIEADAIGATLFSLIMYGISSIPLAYMLSFIPNVPSTGFSLLTVLNIMSEINLQNMDLLRNNQ